MTTIDLAIAQQLAELTDQVAHGQEVIITRADGRMFQLIEISQNKQVPVFGSAKGLIKMSDDFDEPLDEFEEYYR